MSSPAGFRTEPDTSVNSATRVLGSPEFKKLDTEAGWLIVNKWTLKPLRKLASSLLPDVDTSGVSVEEHAHGPDGLLVVRPNNAVGSAVGEGAVLLIHGGGYVLGSKQDVVGSAATIAREVGVPVIASSYRLAPEYPFPAANDDCRSAWHWLLENAQKLNIDPTKVVVGGYSAGGGLAAAVVQRIYDEGGQQPAAQLLVYPMMHDRTATYAGLDSPRHRVWSNKSNRFGWSSYLGHSPGQSSAPYAVPGRREDLSGLPPAWIGVGTSDLFLDEDREYAQRLREAGVEVDYVEIDGGIHGFNMVPDSPLSEAFEVSARAFIDRFTS